MPWLIDRDLKPPNMCVVVKSHEPMAYQRMSLLEQTLDSVNVAFGGSHLFLLCNGIEDGSFEAQCELMREYNFGLAIGPKWFVDENLNDWLAGGPATEPGVTPGHGAHRAAAIAKRHDVVVFSDDDMIWRPDAGERLLRLWQQTPDDLAVVSGLLEPLWAHNEPSETIDCGLARDQRVLVRQSVPGAAWSFLSGRWPEIEERLPAEFGYDARACEALVRDGFRVGAVDLCEHAGVGASTHGNNAIIDLPSKPLDRERWGV